MARVNQWWYAASTSGGQVASWSFAAGLPAGTIQRVIGTVNYWTDDVAGLGGISLGFGYVATVAAVDGAPLAQGADPPETYMRRIMWLSTAPSGTTAVAPRPLERWDLESQRIVEPGADLRFAFSTASPGVAWWWSVEVRVLMLLPEGVG